MNDANHAISVAQLNNYIKRVFVAEEMLHDIYVVGEISGFKISGGATYFTLKDADAVINCTAFFPLKHMAEGTRVITRGTVTYWHKAGKISFIVSKCDEFGKGDLMAALKELQEKLRAEGLFDPEKKRKIPENVRKIGVVTSKTGAVIHDIITVCARRNPAVDIVLFPVAVQGQGAEHEIANAINFFGACGGAAPDILIVARGGGSAEDLMAFNTEIVARAAAKSKIPIISAVGHESDFTILDFVADLRAGTPSIAAEICVREVTTKRDKILAQWHMAKQTATNKIDRLIADLNLFAARADAKNPTRILQSGFAKPLKNLNELKTGDEFEILYYNKTKIEKGVAEWKSKRK
jgi:exodeoxyribonuclease VII large subunit